MVLGKMKETAEAFLGKKVTHAVVTVPACEVSIRHIGRISLLTPLQTSTTLNDRQQKTLGLSPASRSYASSMNPTPPPSPTVLTRSPSQNPGSSSMTSEVAHSTFLFSRSTTVSLRFWLLLVIPTSVVKTLITASLNTSSRNRRRRLAQTSRPIFESAHWAS
jgi:hypothetical protein